MEVAPPAGLHSTQQLSFASEDHIALDGYSSDIIFVFLGDFS